MLLVVVVKVMLVAGDGFVVIVSWLVVMVRVLLVKFVMMILVVGQVVLWAGDGVCGDTVSGNGRRWLYSH